MILIGNVIHNICYICSVNMGFNGVLLRDTQSELHLKQNSVKHLIEIIFRLSTRLIKLTYKNNIF